MYIKNKTINEDINRKIFLKLEEQNLTDKKSSFRKKTIFFKLKYDRTNQWKI